MSNFVFAPMPPTQAENSAWVEWNDGFTSEELATIETYCASALTLVKGGIRGPLAEGDTSHIRKSKVAKFGYNDETAQFYDKLALIIRNLNAQFYRFDLYGFIEDFQYAVYLEQDGGHYDWHIDAASDTIAPRKLSVVLQLSDPADYDGGDLQIYSGGDIGVVSRKRGLLSAFPSFRLHRVTPVERGIRKTIAVWVSGPAFK